MEQDNEGLIVSAEKLSFKDIIDYLYSQGIDIRSAALKQPTLDDVFIQITGKELRE